MGASCYLCASGYSTLPHESAGDAVGVCKWCGVLGCAGHAVYNIGVPEFVCGICLASCLATAAVGNPAPAEPDEEQPDDDGPSGFKRRARSVGDVTDLIPAFGDDAWSRLADEVDYLARFVADEDRLQTTGLAALADDRARRLMAAAIAIATQLGLPDREQLPALRRFMQAVRLHG